MRRTSNPTTHPQIKMAGWPYTPCEKDKSAPFFDSPEPCFDKCVVQSVMSSCGCKFDGSVKYDAVDLPYCVEDEGTMSCAENVEDKWMNDEDECECPLERCEQTKYEIYRSSSRWPSDKSRALDWGEDENPNEYVQANIYFQEFSYEEFSEIPNSNFVAMLSAIGGSLGLCLGMR